MNKALIYPEDMVLLERPMIDLIVPYSCPGCGKIVKRRLESRYCTGCGIVLYSYHYKRKGQMVTIWVAGKDPSCKKLVLRLVGHIRDRPSLSQFQILQQQWIAELGMAQCLLRYCEGSMSLAETVIDLFFDHDAKMEARDFRSIKSMAQIIYKRGDIATMLGLAKKKLGYVREDMRLEQEPETAEMF